MAVQTFGWDLWQWFVGVEARGSGGGGELSLEATMCGSSDVRLGLVAVVCRS